MLIRSRMVVRNETQITYVDTAEVSFYTVMGPATDNASPYVIMAYTNNGVAVPLKRVLTLDLAEAFILEVSEQKMVAIKEPVSNFVDTKKEEPELITEAQRKKLFAVMHDLEWSSEKLHRWLLKRFDVSSVKMLTIEQAEKVIGRLNKKLEG